MFLRRRSVLVITVLGLTCITWLTVRLQNDPLPSELKVFTGIVPMATVAHDNSSHKGQQVRRHLLNTRATHHTPHTSFIKLEGVDSGGNDMFLIQGAIVDQLKLICTALEECEGFNSDGWVKSRVSSKKRADIDLYLKQIPNNWVDVEEMNGIVDEDAGVFMDHMMEYANMEEKLKIYIYDTDIGVDIPSLQDYKYGVETLFIDLLAKSKFRTKNANEATFFFLPSRCTAYRKMVPHLQTGINRAASITREMVLKIKNTFPFWNQTLGTDHFYICAHDMGTEVSKFADVNLWKNSIGLVNTAEYSDKYFVPHKDISLPPHPGRGNIVEWSVMGQGGATFDPYQRTTLAFLAGNGERGPVRPLLYKYFEGDHSFKLVKGHLDEKAYIRALQTSVFCLCPRGNKGWSPRIMDSLWFGCIPVFIADYYVPPLYGLIPWDTISVSIPEHQVEFLKIILQNISAQKISSMQKQILKIYHHLTWHTPPQPYDAFYGVLFQLWQRHHIRRTNLPTSEGGGTLR